MTMTFESFIQVVKTKSESSSLVNGLWVSKSAIRILIDNKMRTLFGFGTDFDRELSETKSKYELLERISFLPYIYDQKSLIKTVYFYQDNLLLRCENAFIKNYLVGAASSYGYFYGNGCAISSDPIYALMHSQRELMERHICSLMWYKNLTLEEKPKNIEILIPNISVRFFEYIVDVNEHFVMCVIDDPGGFFAVGAAIRSTYSEASRHAVGEVAMLYEDAKKNRFGIIPNQKTKQLFSLRDKQICKQRKKYFEKLLTYSYTNHLKQISLEAILFEPFPNIYAARSFSLEALDPRELELKANVPTLPLY